MNIALNPGNAARAIILAGLLTGLLFSSGEGIHLFPFPQFAGEHDRTPKVTGGERTGYQENAQRVEKNQEKFQSRSQRDQEKWSAALRGLDNALARRQLTVVSVDPSVSPHFFRSQLFATTIRGRAPPVS